MNNSEIQNMIEKYKKELVEYAKKNEGYIANMPEEDMMDTEPEAVPAQTTVTAPQMTSPVTQNNQEPREITELEGTNPEGYVSGRVDPPYATYEDFLNSNPGKGYLKVQTFAGREAFPVVNANVVVSKMLASSEQIIHNKYTDISGVVDNLELSAPSKELSEEPNNSIPYATYVIKVSHPYFLTTIFKNVPVFDSVKSIQQVAMVPRTGTPADDKEIVYDESGVKDL